MLTRPFLLLSTVAPNPPQRVIRLLQMSRLLSSRHRSKSWEDLAQRGEVGQQSMWSDMGAHLNKPDRRGGGPGRAPSDLWSREANLDLAQMHGRGEWPADISTRCPTNSASTTRKTKSASQLEALGLVGSSRKLPGSAIGEWQPDAMAILQSDRVKWDVSRTSRQLIEQETGQVTTKNSVIGKLQRLRQERQRAELAEDLAKSGISHSASSVQMQCELRARVVRRKSCRPDRHVSQTCRRSWDWSTCRAVGSDIF